MFRQEAGCHLPVEFGYRVGITRVIRDIRVFKATKVNAAKLIKCCLLYTSPSPRD